MANAFWYVIGGRLSHASYPSREKARQALSVVRGTYGYGPSEGAVIEAASDADAMGEARKLAAKKV